MIDRETDTSALAGPLVNARATSAGVAPWAPSPGRSRIDFGISRRASPTARGYVAPTTAPTLERPCSPTTSSPHAATSSATWCQTRRPSESASSWTSALPPLDVFTSAKMPVPARLPALPALQVGVGVGTRRRADVAPLAVREEEEPRVSRVLAHLLEGGDPR